MNNDILVSICCITYNQEKYIKDAIEGFLMQKTKFKFEVIIYDDASTDNTTNIIRQYEKKYPDIIKPIYQKENQYSKGKQTFLFTFQKARGKYIALCEGDDYWIDENKLQSQIEYMQQNKDCTFIFHNAKIIDMVDNKHSVFIPYSEKAKKYIKKDNNYNVGELELLGFIPTASFMFRKDAVERIPEWFDECFVGDWPLKLIMTSFGYAHYMDKVMSIYRKNANGSVTVKNSKREKRDIEGKLHIIKQKEKIVKYVDEYTQYIYHDVFEKRLIEYEIETLMHKKQGKEIIEKGHVKYIPLKKRWKYILKIYMPDEIYNILRKMKNKK